MKKVESEKKKATDCIHCHKCTKSCELLSKYGIDIGDVEKLKEIAYHCFLCGKCTEVCPIGIDGREIILNLRRERAASDEKATIESQYKGLIREKKNYKFSNWKHASSGSVFFPGCNFPSMFPKTNAEIVKIFKEHGIGTVYECCGKPIAELGFQNDEERIIRNIREKLAENNITEVITGCPNCRDFFGDRLGVKVTGIFSKFAELNVGNVIEGDYTFFIPCPDRKEMKWIDEIRPFIKGDIKYINGVLCCGLGGSAIMFEPEIADSFTEKLKEQSEQPNIVTYCASCTGRFKRSGFGSIDHIITKVVGTNETPDTMKSYLNRVMTKFK